MTHFSDQSGEGVPAERPALGGPDPRGKRRTGRISRGLASLSASAIIAVYAVGYLQTQSAADQLDALAATSTSITLTATTTAAPASLKTGNSAPIASAETTSRAATPTRAASATPTTSAVRATATSAVTTYKDGAYVGSGMSRHGGIQATVVVKGGKIVSAAITGASTRYPVSRIASLPGAVVSQQNVSVHVVSGASDSSNAYIQAVKAALANAM